jgi:hypothetical protein
MVNSFRKRTHFALPDFSVEVGPALMGEIKEKFGPNSIAIV